MKLDLKDYLVHLPTIKNMIENRRYDNVREILADMALATQCHILACTYYTIHFVGESPELNTAVKDFKQFYKIKEIVSWPLELVL